MNRSLERAVLDTLRWEPDIAFRRRNATLIGWLDPGPGDLVVDAGCGLGFGLHLLAALTPARLVGVEFAPDRLATAIGDRGFTQAALLAGDVTRLPLVDSSAAGVLLCEVIEHLPDDRAALAEAWRILRPGGRLAVSVPHAAYPALWDPPNAIRRATGGGHFQDEPWSGIWTDHQRLYQPGELAALAREAGFDVAACNLQVRWSVPFAHHLVYGAGKALAGRNVGASQRWDLWGPEARPAWPVRVGVQLMQAPDRLNQDAYQDGSAVGICLLATKPATP